MPCLCGSAFVLAHRKVTRVEQDMRRACSFAVSCGRAMEMVLARTISIFTQFCAHSALDTPES